MNGKTSVVSSSLGRVDVALLNGLLTGTQTSYSGDGDQTNVVFEVPAASREEANDILREKGVVGNIEWADWSPANFAEGQVGPGIAYDDPRRNEPQGGDSGGGDGGAGDGAGDGSAA